MQIINLKQQNDLYDQVVRLYIRVYSEPPYNELFNYDQVFADLKQYFNNGILLVMVDNDIVIGFLMATVGYSCDENLTNKLKNIKVSCDNDIYLSELGVCKNHRCKGIAKSLMIKMFEIYKNKTVFLRTGKYDNDQIINYYKNFDFVVTNIEESVENVRNDNTIDNDVRLYMVKYHHCLH